MRAKCPGVHEVSDRVLGRLSSVQTHQGVSAIVRRTEWSPDDLFGSGRADATAPLVVVAAGVRDPGNLGALVRSAEAAEATGLLVIEGSADPYRDKALRGSAGSAFRLPCLTLDVNAAVDLLTGRGVQILVAVRAGAISCWDVDWTRPSAVVLGAEGHGIPARLADAGTGSVAIPLADPVESLNVAVAAGVLLFEARRQRR